MIRMQINVPDDDMPTHILFENNGSPCSFVPSAYAPPRYVAGLDAEMNVKWVLTEGYDALDPPSTATPIPPSCTKCRTIWARSLAAYEIGGRR